MSNYETVTTGRSKRSTAGNRMRELLEKAHQEDDDDIFKEVEDDEEFSAPQDVKDVYLEEFADTDEEVDEDEEAEERAIRKEERKKAKGKGRAIYDPLSNINKGRLQNQQSKADDSTTKLLEDPTISLLDPTLDPSNMAPSTLILALRKKRREVKREQLRSEARRSNLRASTLKTDIEIAEKEKLQNETSNNNQNKGRRAKNSNVDHERKNRVMTQDELIAAALEMEEKNKEALKDWLKKEDEKRELRKISRKRVKGPRLTWVSRTVGKLIEVIGESNVVEEEVPAEKTKATEEEKKVEDTHQEKITPTDQATEQPNISVVNEDIAITSADRQTSPVTKPSPTSLTSTQNEPTHNQVATNQPPTTQSLDADVDQNPPSVNITANIPSAAQTPSPLEPKITDGTTSLHEPTAVPMVQLQSQEPSTTTTPLNESGNVSGEPLEPIVGGSALTDTPADKPSSQISSNLPTSIEAGPSKAALAPPTHVPEPSTPEKQAVEQTTDDYKYTRNYLILSQIPGGLTEEIKLILGDHVEWDQLKYIPARMRPINRRLPICPFTGLPAKYRHPATMIPYATKEGFQQIEALLHERYKYDAGGWWIGGEEDIHAEGMEGVEGWWEAVNGGWLGGNEIPPEPEPEEVVQEELIVTEDIEPVEEAEVIIKGKRKIGRESASATPVPIPKKAKKRGRPSKVKIGTVGSGEELSSPVAESSKPRDKGKKR
ncbi:uncharacterized protein L201_003783 [Kwoniella dendrophila CBS 6074]|uniref:Vps72/YL1 C-terminal domain-containing protein n=1 Tax=Kwoniella dendrophila CBS 6074 TaxID=1295534 RepID=A0AAX4JVL9_9TREE